MLIQINKQWRSAWRPLGEEQQDENGVGHLRDDSGDEPGGTIDEGQSEGTEQGNVEADVYDGVLQDLKFRLMSKALVGWAAECDHSKAMDCVKCIVEDQKQDIDIKDIGGVSFNRVTVILADNGFYERDVEAEAAMNDPDRCAQCVWQALCAGHRALPKVREVQNVVEVPQAEYADNHVHAPAQQ